MTGVRDSSLAVDRFRAASSEPNLFLRAVRGDMLAAPPIWLMRQAGRYHHHYQRLRAQHSFEDLCRSPELAAEVAMGPVADFDFDAAILFSDLLFPLEALGFGLSYAEGPPKLSPSLTFDQLRNLRRQDEALVRLMFQRDALLATRARLPRDKGLIGFVGGPWTLFVYAVEGTHAGRLARAKSSLDLYRAFADQLTPLLLENIRLQFDGGADVVMVFDTAGGELGADVFTRVTAPDLTALARAFPGRLGYYAKGIRSQHISGRTHERHTSLGEAPWAGFGLDMQWDLTSALQHRAFEGFVQGNFDPQSLLLTGAPLEQALREYLRPLRDLEVSTRRGWICGLGHGVLPATPEESVRTFVTTVREAFR
jgi:uroporphyrinogen decarboxylase